MKYAIFNLGTFPVAHLCHSGNNFSARTCCEIALSVLQLPQLHLLDVDLGLTPAHCIWNGEWLRAGLDVPPRIGNKSKWNIALRYVAQLRACCNLLCRSRLYIASSLFIRVSFFQPPLYPCGAGNVAVSHFPTLTIAQLQLLLCMAGHASHFIRVMMPKDVRHNKDPRQELLRQNYSASLVQRLIKCDESLELVTEVDKRKRSAMKKIDVWDADHENYLEMHGFAAPVVHSSDASDADSDGWAGLNGFGSPCYEVEHDYISIDDDPW